MARLFIDGFERGDLAFWSYYVNNGAISSTVPTGMTGTYTVWCNAANGVYCTLPAAQSEIYVAFKYHFTELSGKCIANFRDSSGTKTYSVIRNTTTSVLEARLGSLTDTLQDTGTATITNNTTYLIEIRYKPLDSGGVLIVKVDGVEDMNVSGDTTAGSENVLVLNLGSDTGVADYAYAYFDDVVIDSADWIGNTKIQKIVPSGAGTTTQWDPSTGSNYTCVDEIPPSNTDYVSTNTSDEIDTYAMGDLSGTIGVVKCVQVEATAAYEGSPTPTHIQLAARSGSTNYFSADKSPPLTFGKPLFHIWETDPNTSSAWTESNVNAAEFGIKATA